MENDTHEKVYNVLLDVQKQIGAVSRETGEQTKKLDALNEKVATANGRTAKNESAIATNAAEIATLREWRKYILGGLAVATVTGMMAATYYIEKIATKTANEAISSLENKYKLRIEEE
jgi:phage-related tail protein